MADYDDHGIHAADPASDAEAIEWIPVHMPLERGRVREHTCRCRAVTYELCSAGSWWIRRYDGRRVVESGHVAASRAQELWGRLLRGEAA